MREYAFYTDIEPGAAKAFTDFLDAAPNSRNVLNRLNSLGGDVTEGLTIANIIRERQSQGWTFTGRVDGIAASIATVILAACATRQIFDTAIVAVHLPWAVTIGDRNDHTRTIDVLDKWQASIVAIYALVLVGKSAEDIIAILTPTTWWNSEETVASGLATEILPSSDAGDLETTITAKFEARAFAKLTPPDRFRPRVAAMIRPVPQAANALEAVKLCTAEGYPQSALAYIEAGATLKAIQEGLARAKHITGICKLGRVAALADGYVRSGMSVADVQTHVTTITAMLDVVEIDGSLAPEGGAAEARSSRDSDPFGVFSKRLTTEQIYARRNRTDTGHHESRIR